MTTINIHSTAGRALLVAAYFLWNTADRAGTCMSSAQAAEMPLQDASEKDVDALVDFIGKALEQNPPTGVNACLALPVTVEEMQAAFAQWVTAQHNGWRAPLPPGLTPEQYGAEATATVLGYIGSSRTLNLALEMTALLPDGTSPRLTMDPVAEIPASTTDEAKAADPAEDLFGV